MSGVFDPEPLFAAIDARDADAFAAFLTEDAEFRFGNAPPVVGRPAIAAYCAAFFAGLGGLTHRLESIWEVPEGVVCHGVVSYRRRDGSELTVPFANVLYLASDRVRRYLIFVDNGALFQGPVPARTLASG